MVHAGPGAGARWATHGCLPLLRGVCPTFLSTRWPRQPDGVGSHRSSARGAAARCCLLLRAFGLRREAQFSLAPQSQHAHLACFSTNPIAVSLGCLPGRPSFFNAMARTIASRETRAMFAQGPIVEPVGKLVAQTTMTASR